MLFSLCLLSASFAADLKPAGTAELSGTVDVPLYAGVDPWDPTFYVEVKVGEKSTLLRVATGHDELRLTGDGATALGVTLKGEEGKDKKAKIAELDLGGVKLTDVVVIQHAAPSARVSYPPRYPKRAMPSSGEIGLSGFTGLAFAVLPSEGILRLAPADQGATLVAALGSSLDYSFFGGKKQKVGAGPAVNFNDTPLVVELAVSGQNVHAVLAMEEFGSVLVRELELEPRYFMKGKEQRQISFPPAPTWSVAEFDLQWREVAIGPVSTWTSIGRAGLGPMALFAPDGAVGQDVLRMVDLALDPVNHKIGVKAASSLKLQDYRPLREAALKKALEPTPVEEGKEQPSEEDKKKARIAALKPLASWYDATGHSDLAVPLWKEVTTGEDNICGSWLSLGQSLLRTGQPADALSASRKAAELYDGWAALSLEERSKQQKAYDAAQKKKEEWTGVVPQDHKCHTAWGDVAEAMFAMKDYSGIAALYPSKMDLDEELALVAGSALLMEGKTEQAQAAYLQAIAVERTGSPAARAGMLLTARNWEQAQAQIGASGWLFFLDDPYLLSVYLETAKKFGGEAAVNAELDRLLAMAPADPVLLLAKGDYSKAAERLQSISTRMPSSAMVQAAQAQLLLAQGRAAEAKTTAERATQMDAGDAYAWYVLASAEQALNEADNAGKHYARASQLRGANPAYARLGK